MRLMPLSFLTVAALGGCAKISGDDVPSDSATPVVVDGDGDGVSFEEDCDDEDASVGAIDSDADCDGVLTADDCTMRMPNRRCLRRMRTATACSRQTTAMMRMPSPR